jgi:large subunit ribosomal protein L25
MENIQLVAEAREATNKGAARRLRKTGKIPAVIYGEGEPKAISVDEKDWITRFRNIGGNTILTLKLDGKDMNVLIKDTQDDILTGRVSHIDFFTIRADHKLNTMVPVHLEGSAKGVKEGGILEHKVEELSVYCLPKDMPSHFTVDISDLDMGDSVHVKDLKVPEGVEIREDDDLTIVVVTHPKSAAESESEEVEEEAEDSAVAEEGE